MVRWDNFRQVLNDKRMLAGDNPWLRTAEIALELEYGFRCPYTPLPWVCVYISEGDIVRGWIPGVFHMRGMYDKDHIRDMFLTVSTETVICENEVHHRAYFNFEKYAYDVKESIEFLAKYDPRLEIGTNGLLWVVVLTEELPPL